MTTALATAQHSPTLPSVIHHAGERASFRFVEFFTANIRNKNTRGAYARAVNAFFASCEDRGVAFERIDPVLIAAYIETLLAAGMAKPSVKQHLAAIRMVFDFMVMGGIMPFNPGRLGAWPSPRREEGKNSCPAAGRSPAFARLRRRRHNRGAA